MFTLIKTAVDLLQRKIGLYDDKAYEMYYRRGYQQGYRERGKEC